MAKIVIQTPRGQVIQIKTKTGKTTANLVWNPSFGARKTEDFSKAQQFIDSEVLRLCAPLVPFQTGMLQKSGTLGTVVGSGEVQYVAPYAAEQYYHTPTTRSYDPQRGARWFERMKADHQEEILRVAKRLAGGK